MPRDRQHCRGGRANQGRAHYYIESKEDLLFEIMNYAMERLETMVIEPSRAVTDAEQRLHSILVRHGRLLTEGNKAITILTDEIEGLKPKHRKQILDRKARVFRFRSRHAGIFAAPKASCGMSIRPLPRSACSARCYGSRAGFDLAAG